MSQAAPQAAAMSGVYQMYTRFPGVPYAYCRLKAELGDAAGPVNSVIVRIAVDGLAHSIGLREEDVLISINKAYVSQASVPSIIDTLKLLNVDLPIAFGVRRTVSQQDVYFWFVVQLLVDNAGKPYVQVISSQSNTTGIIPDFQGVYQIYMRFPGVPYAYCSLKANLGDAAGPVNSVIVGIAVDGLAHSIGLRKGDVPISINKAYVSKVSVPSIIDTLKWLNVNLPIAFGVRRTVSQQDVYFWFVVQLLVDNAGKPYVQLISSQSNTTGIIPDFQVDFENVYTFQYNPPPEKEEIVQSITNQFLAVSGSKIEFINQQAQFLVYKYSTTAPPSKGSSVALVFDATGSTNCIETVKENEVLLQLTTFPNYMKNPNQQISSNGRFFFQNTNQDNAYETFESETNSGYFITENQNNYQAFPRSPKNQYSDMAVHDNGPA